MSDLLVATQGFTATVNGRVVNVRAGEIAHPNAAVVRGRRTFFKPVEVRYAGPVEDATAEPGRRSRARFSKPAKASTGGSDNGSGAGSGSGDPKGSYTDLKQPELKAELDKRGLEYPKGAVRNATLIELLEADDAAA